MRKEKEKNNTYSSTASFPCSTAVFISVQSVHSLAIHVNLCVHEKRQQVVTGTVHLEKE